MEKSQIDALSERVNRLECGIRRWKQVSLAIALGGVIMLFFGGAHREEVDGLGRYQVAIGGVSSSFVVVTDTATGQTWVRMPVPNANTWTDMGVPASVKN
jgi:hypothetical protein